ncbi:hypothetical protein [Colwellia piezophila]|uniref:hypothetical protein n=1 Tax=Colwellia piezophila TaxID=211668 RepID=UPI0003723B9B|nr:hypothetical protein [Colwellia piezophila]
MVFLEDADGTGSTLLDNADGTGSTLLDNADGTGSTLLDNAGAYYPEHIIQSLFSGTTILFNQCIASMPFNSR